MPPTHKPTRRRQRLLVIALAISPFVAFGALFVGIVLIVPGGDRPTERLPAVGAGAGVTGGANALGELLSGNNPDEREAQRLEAARTSVLEPGTWPGGVILRFDPPAHAYLYIRGPREFGGRLVSLPVTEPAEYRIPENLRTPGVEVGSLVTARATLRVDRAGRSLPVDAEGQAARFFRLPPAPSTAVDSLDEAMPLIYDLDPELGPVFVGQ